MTNSPPSADIRQRLLRLQQELANTGLDGAIILAAIDLYYYSGTRQHGALWIPSAAPPVLLIRKSLSRACAESTLEDIRPFPPSREIESVLGGGVKRIGMTFDVVPAQHLRFYESILPKSTFVDISAINREIRSVKSSWEQEQVQISGRMLAGVFQEIPSFLRRGMRELDLAAELELRLRRTGIGGFLRIRGFNQEITGLAVAGPHGAAPGCFDGPVTGRGFWTSAPYGPSRDPIPEGAPILIDYGGSYNGYLTDMTRIFCFGPMDPELAQAFSLSREIQDWIREHLRPGAICEDIYAGAVGMATRAGRENLFMGPPGEEARFVGHGVGLELDELPVLAPKCRAPLQAGQILAVEPKFSFPGRGTVGIENTFAITTDACKKLTDLADDLVTL